MNDIRALISFKTMMSRDPTVFAQAIKFLATAITIEEISSVYRVHRKAESFSSIRRVGGEEILDGYSCVVLAKIRIEATELIRLIRQTEEKLRSEHLRRSLSCNLLVYGNEVMHFPDLTLPHPEFHLRPEEVIPASEVWGDFLHPILKVSIKQLARDYVDKDWGEYYSSGRPLLDF